LREVLARSPIYLLAAIILLTVLHFPYDVDQPLSDRDLDAARKYYADAYEQAADPESEATPSEFETRYLEFATYAAESFDIEGQVRTFVEEYGLEGKRVLDIGSGRGYLQDLVDDYTGLDISSSVARFYHKDFVLGSATAMPFADDSFDAAWSIWVQEHVPNPEQFLRETRRVVRDGGVIFLHTAWGCVPWAAQGYEVRPYADFGVGGKLVKATIPVRKFTRTLAVGPIRAARTVASLFGPTALHYQLLEPNYEVYWQADSDAINGIDAYEALLWFTSRGDECLNCGSALGSFLMHPKPLVIRVHKTG